MQEDRPGDRRVTGARLTVLAAVLLVAVLLARWSAVTELWAPRRESSSLRGAPPANRLAIGSKAIVQGPLSLAVAGLVDLDYLGKDGVLSLRRDAVLRHAGLLLGEYSASPAIFADIEDGRPWWGLAGRFYFGAGDRSPEGLTQHSETILNPYLLVGDDFWHDSPVEWDQGKVTAQSVTQPVFQFLPRLLSLTWWAGESRAEATYDYSGFVERQSPLLDPATSFRDPRLDLIAVNARDLGLSYIHVDVARSVNVGQAGRRTEAAAIRQFFHAGRSCGIQGGCNNLSPRSPEIEALVIEALPARIVIRLWRDRPASVLQRPDFAFTVNVE